LGPNAPPIATYEEVLADTDANAGNFAAARPEVDRALEVIYKAFPTGHSPKVAEILETRAAVEAGEGRIPAALATLRKAREITLAIEPRPVTTLSTIDTMLAAILAQTGDEPGATRYLEEAIAAVRAQDPRSVQLAMLLLDYGQILATTDLDGALRTLAEAREMLEALHDPRVSYAAAAMAVIEVQAHRWVDARKHAEEAVAFAEHDPGAIPLNTAEMQFDLAQAMVETHGDKKRALELAKTAHATTVAIGPEAATWRKRIETWQARHR
jgi:tetratricopeptide (TPR) repeat protein